MGWAGPTSDGHGGYSKDGGRTFTKFLAELGVKQQFTVPYTPEEHPTKRANHTIKTMISQFSDEDQSGWDELIPELSLAINNIYCLLIS